LAPECPFSGKGISLFKRFISQSLLQNIAFENITKSRAHLKAGKPCKRHFKVNILSQKVYGRITNYQVGNKSQTPKVCLIEFQGIASSSDAGKLVGQKVAWKSGKSLMVGHV
jgi:hypothetical protein